MDSALVGGNDFFCNAESQAKVHFISMGLVRTVEAVKDSLFILFGNATSSVRDRKTNFDSCYRVRILWIYAF